MVARPALITAVTIFLLTSGAAPVMAADPFAEQRSVVVKYKDLDLTKERGVVALTARIAHAADAACGPVDFRNLQDLGLFHACRTAAIQAAMAEVRTAAAAAHHSFYAASPAKPVGTD